MSITPIPLLQQVRSQRLEVVSRWEALSAVMQARVKVVVLVGATFGAYHYSLLSLLQTVGFDTPLAYVGLVPLLAAGLAWMRRTPTAIEPDIHDRQLDYILGVPLVGIAIVMVFVLPHHFGEMYWVYRLDLLSLPVFVAGAVALLFGTRVLWRQKVAVLYLLLAWPWPYSSILLGTLGGFTSLTLDGLNHVLKIVHVAKSVPGVGNAGLYEIVHHGRAFPISVVTACSGVDGMVGFFLVGAGFATIVAGPLLRKVLWLLSGLVLLWTTNLLRLVGIFWLGQHFGEHLAIGIVHPVAGVVVFCVGIVLMMLLLRPFGLRLADAPGTRRPASRTAATFDAPRRRAAAPRVFLSAGIIALASIFLAVNNSSLVQYDPVASAAGEPKLASFLARPASPAGWQVNYETEYTINKPLFGQSSRWFRYLYTQTTGQPHLSSNVPVTADVIDAGGLSGFQQYGVTACYSFHGYTLRDVAKVSLGAGISGEAMSYSSRTAGDWSIVYWIWPVKTSTGTRYERVILYIQNTAAAKIVAPAHVAGVQGLPGALSPTDPNDRRLIVNREFLVTFARQIVQGQIKEKAAPADIAALSPGFATAQPVSQAERNLQDQSRAAEARAHAAREKALRARLAEQAASKHHS